VTPGKDELTLAIAVLGAATGTVGCVLGLLNTWRAFDRDRVKLRVQPRCAFFSVPVEGASTLLCIDVTNTGFVPVTVSQIIFNLRKPRKHFLFFVPLPGLSDSLPHRLELRTSMNVFVPPHIPLEEGFGYVTTACAETECGRKFKANSGALESFVKQARAKSRVG